LKEESYSQFDAIPKGLADALYMKVSNNQLTGDITTSNKTFTDTSLVTKEFVVNAIGSIDIKTVDVAKSVLGVESAGNSQYYGKNDVGTVGFFDFPVEKTTKQITHNARLALVDGRLISINGQIPPSVTNMLRDILFTDYISYGEYTNIESGHQGLSINSVSGKDSTVVLNSIGPQTNFYMSVDVNVGVGAEAGITFRTTTPNDNQNSYAYSVRLKAGQVLITKGTNGESSNGFVVLAAPICSVNIDSFNTLEVSVFGDKISVCVNGDFVKSIKDSSFTGAGSVGLYVYNDSSLESTLGNAIFKNLYIHYPGSFIQNM
jgi:hypothetical protein